MKTCKLSIYFCGFTLCILVSVQATPEILPGLQITADKGKCKTFYIDQDGWAIPNDKRSHMLSYLTGKNAEIYVYGSDSATVTPIPTKIDTVLAYYIVQGWHVCDFEYTCWKYDL